MINPVTGKYYRTIALNGSASEDERADAFESLAMDEFDANEKMQPLPDVMIKLNIALKQEGTLYVSFKYGEGTMTKGDRIISNFTEESVKKLLENSGFVIYECGVSSDIRPERDDEKWVNVIARKSVGD